MSNVFGSCVDLHTTWAVDGDMVTFNSNVPGQAPITICLSKSTIVDNGDGTATLTQSNGTEKVSVVCGAQSTVVDNGNGTGTVTMNDGTTKDFLCAGNVSSVEDNGDGTATITMNDGSVKDDVVCGIVSTIEDNGDGTATVTQTDGSTKDVVCAPFTDNFSTTMDNGDGTFTTTNPDGTSVTWTGDTFAAGASNNDGTATLIFPDGSTLVVCEAPCPVLVDNGDGTADLTVGDETKTIVCGVQSTVEENGDGTATMTQNDGTTKDVVCAPLEAADGSPVPVGTAGNLCVTPGLVDCDGDALLKGEGIVRKIVDPSNSVPWPTDGAGNQIAQCACASINLVKSALPGPYEEGDEVLYTFTVINTGTLDLTNVNITDAKVGIVGGPIALLPVGGSDSTTFTGTYTYTADDVAAGGCINVATATGVDANGNVVADSDDAEIFNLAPPEMPAITLTKMITNGNDFGEGDTIEYSFVVTNTGDVTLSNVTVTDPLLTVAGGPISMNPMDVDSTTFTGSYVVTAADVTAGTVDNTAEVTGVSPAGTTVDATSDASVDTKDCEEQVITLTGEEIFNGTTLPDGTVVGWTDNGGYPTPANPLVQPALPAPNLDGTEIHLQALSDNDGNPMPIDWTITMSNAIPAKVFFRSLNGTPSGVGMQGPFNGVANPGDSNNYEQVINMAPAPSAVNAGVTGTWDGTTLQSAAGNNTADVTFPASTSVSGTYNTLQVWRGIDPDPGQIPSETGADNLYIVSAEFTICV